ncbi:3'5'-cyclic nucleotide phosphodiesterase domain-containing protein [Toxoplasma gondii ME49]|uniref:Phosphodiesterase n=3 Tax=Toxoplasma gondii TaxID=5811 RepID=A0A125YJK4_TOXGV|nr:3'5'-cyclic nucleotide phosphodiesterase domain-containing protein [Toxoplasma gondii ME49]EPT29239.1 3'5'-cyclic nucleotide phosphodiesterase domain-containing protein [Toxoplasma gondii ME49]ESS28618.1 3'5'-cyclic nucleotide phosphodiesterase domain-containing protein [Toxoplasma gondii VEG]PIM03626.1 3'5'-cyclic nucleotide phosphodiesterase domain-containing protein [Toxoplasma gondii COUG]|eukprot:XP_018636968.1 3'5'-cyclic nucleotide phosphodiesterase domain-containing protein [Toxoplasma gondii ME49]
MERRGHLGECQRSPPSAPSSTLLPGSAPEAKMLSCVDLERAGSDVTVAPGPAGSDSVTSPYADPFRDRFAVGRGSVLEHERCLRRRRSDSTADDTAMPEICVDKHRPSPKLTAASTLPRNAEDLHHGYHDVEAAGEPYGEMNNASEDRSSNSQFRLRCGRQAWETRPNSAAFVTALRALPWASALVHAPPVEHAPIQPSPGGGVPDAGANRCLHIDDTGATDNDSIRPPSLATIALSPSSSGSRSPHPDSIEGADFRLREVGTGGDSSPASSLESMSSPSCVCHSTGSDTFVSARSDETPRFLALVAVHGKPRPTNSNCRLPPAQASESCAGSGWREENRKSSAIRGSGRLSEVTANQRKTRSGQNSGQRNQGARKSLILSENLEGGLPARVPNRVDESDLELAVASPVSSVFHQSDSRGKRCCSKENEDSRGPQTCFRCIGSSKKLHVRQHRNGESAGDAGHAENPQEAEWRDSRTVTTPSKDAQLSGVNALHTVPRMHRKKGAKELPEPSSPLETCRDREAEKVAFCLSGADQGRQLGGDPPGPIRRYVSRFLEMWGGDDWGSTYYDSFSGSRGDIDAVAHCFEGSVAADHQWNAARRHTRSRSPAGCGRHRSSSADGCLVVAAHEAGASPRRGVFEGRHTHSQTFSLVKPASFQWATTQPLEQECASEAVDCGGGDAKATANEEPVDQNHLRRKVMLLAERNREDLRCGWRHGAESAGGHTGDGDAALALPTQTKSRHGRGRASVWSSRGSSPLAFEYRTEEEAYRQYLNRLFPFRLMVVGMVLLLVEILQISWRLVQRSFLVDSQGQYSYYGLVNFDLIFVVIAVCLVIHIIVYSLLAAGGRIPGVKNRLESWSFTMIVLALLARICGMVCVAFMSEGIGDADAVVAGDGEERPVAFTSAPRALSSELVLLSLCCLFHVIVIDMMLPVRTLPSMAMHTVHILGCIGCCVLSVCLYPQCISSDGPICAVSTCLFIVCGFLGRAQMEVAHRQLYMRWKDGLERLRAAEQKLHSHRTSKTGIEQLAMLVRQSQVLLRHACVSGSSRQSKQLALEQVADIQGQVLDIVTNVNNLYHAQMNTEEMSELLRFLPEGQDDAQRSLLRDWRGRSASFSGCGPVGRDSEQNACTLNSSILQSTCSTLCLGNVAPRNVTVDAPLTASTHALPSSRYHDAAAGHSCVTAPEGGVLGEGFGKTSKDVSPRHAESTSGDLAVTSNVKHDLREKSECDATRTLRQDPMIDLPDHMKAAIGVAWDLDFFELNERVNNNALLVTGQVQLLPLLRPEGLRCSPQVVRCYLRCLQQQYCPSNPYHNQLHAAMVSHCCLIIVNEVLPSKQALTYVDELCLIIASVAHDVGHPGLNNQYLISSQSLLATTYNDIAVLENYHAACCFRTAGINEDHNIFSGLAKEVYQYMRQNIIGLILSTDMSKHISYVSRLRVRAESGNFDVNNEGDRWLLFQGCIKAADLAHTATFWDNHKRWAECLCEEFFKQGDEERRQGMNVMDIFDRRQKDRFPQSQYRFIELVVEPLFNSVCSIEDLLKGRGGVRGKICKTLSSNLARWKEAAEALEKPAAGNSPKSSEAKTTEEGGETRKAGGAESAEKKESEAGACTPKSAGAVGSKTGDRRRSRIAGADASGKEAESQGKRRDEKKPEKSKT